MVEQDFSALKDEIISRSGSMMNGRWTSFFEKAMNIDELMGTIRWGFCPLCQDRIITAELVDKYSKEFAAHDIHHNVDVESGYLICDGTAKVKASGDAHVWAAGAANVIVREAVHVTAVGEAKVRAFDFTEVKAYDQAMVTAYNNARVEVGGRGSVDAFHNSQVFAGGAANVIAFDNARVVATAASRVVAHGIARVVARDDARVSAHDKVWVEAYDMAQVKAFDRARVDAQSVSSYYSEYQRPEGMADGAARVHKVKGDDRQWYVSARVADGVFTKPAKLDRIDIAAYHLGEATADQLAGKYLQKEFKTAMEKHLSQSQNVINNQSIKL